MSLPQYRLLLFLRNGPKKAGEVALTSFVTKATISSRINAMKEKGWIVTQPGEEDRRISRLILTDKGRQKMEAFERILLDRLRELLGDQESEPIFRALTTLYVILGESVESRFKNINGIDGRKRV